MRKNKSGLILLTAGIVLGVLMATGTPSSEAQVKGSLRLNAYFAKGFNDIPWQTATFEKVGKAWAVATPPAIGKKTVVMTHIAHDGKLIDSAVTTESGSASWDKAGAEAVKKAAPFAALPKSWAPGSLEVHFHFEFVAVK